MIKRKKRKLIVIALLLISLNLYSNDFKNITLLEYTKEVAYANNINIFIDEDIDNKISFFIPTLKKPTDLFKAYEIAIKNKSLRLIKKSNFYYIKKKLLDKKKIYIHQLQNNTYEDIKIIFKAFKIDTKYLHKTNSILFETTKIMYDKILPLINKIDKLANQVTLKFIIFEIRDDFIKDIGIKYSSLYENITHELSTALDTILIPFTSTHGILKSTSFYGALKLLEKNNYVNINQFPFVLAKHNKEFIFQAVENIPYTISTVSTSASNVQNQTLIEYRDIGLKIKGKSKIYTDFINLDLDLTIENVIQNGNEATPSTFKRLLTSNVDLKYNEVLLLSGIKQDKITKGVFSIPFISNIPYLGEIFKYKYSNKENSHITIAIEIIDNDNLAKKIVHDDTGFMNYD